MSCSTPWPNEPRRRLLGASGLALLGVWPQAQGTTPATAPPGTAHPQLPGSRLIGHATLRYWGLQVYTARLWAGADFRPQRLGEHPLLLELEYLRALKGPAIAERSVQEMRRAGGFSDAQAQRWQAAMQQVFPDVQAGDRLAGLHRPEAGAAFWLNGQPAGEVADPLFSRLFFGIWLAPTTSEPDMRQALLGPTLASAR